MTFSDILGVRAADEGGDSMMADREGEVIAVAIRLMMHQNMVLIPTTK